MKKFFDRLWFYKVVALFLAIVLAIYVNFNQPGFVPEGQRNATIKTATKKENLKVPLQVSVDTDKYYVTGYPEKVSLSLSGSTALVTSTVNTQNFRVFIDLSKFKPGKHTVPVKVNGLSNQLSYSINPKKITVNIQKRKSKSFPVQIEYNKDAVPTPYKVGTAKSDPSVVTVTGATSEVNQIDKIVARVVIPKDEIKSYLREVILIAEDKAGRQLNVVIDPATTNVTIPISLPKKTVKLSLTSHGGNQDKIYSLSSNIDTIKIYGKDETLKKIDELPIDVDLSHVNADTEKTIPIKLPKGVYQTNPAQVSVKIKVSNSNGKKD
ncbi:YbbR-like domain-containing protein [Lactobacillus sp. PV034]|uniref:CdaR family protein n=1 Tax=Lactobacillus sp. PV034 TaxID=2594495 RepID=UPI002240BE13|nr:CdaR family protein [Lactobacillus sp. PV034]QNQ80693.1 hypothetical protein FP432_03580 [Lactobacillus sp. PV034]